MSVKIISSTKRKFTALTKKIPPETFSGTSFVNALYFSDMRVEYVYENELHKDRDYIFLYEPQWTEAYGRKGYEQVFKNAISEIPKSIKEKLNEYNIKIVISTINEPWGIHPYDILKPNFRACIREKIPQNKCLYLVGNQSIFNDLKSQGIRDLVRVINYWSFHYYSPDWLRKIETTKPKKLDKHFVCLNRTIKTHRTALLFYLYENNLLDKGYVTFYPSVNEMNYFKHNSVHEPEYHYNEELFSKVDKLLPLKMDTEKVDPNSDNPTYYQAAKRIEKVFQNSFMNVVTETWTSNKFLFLSEKMYKPIYLKQPFLVVGNPYTIKYLRDNGFDVFDDIFDHSYDEELDENKRLRMVVDVIKKICNKPLVELSETLHTLEDRLEKNRKHFFHTYMPKQKNLLKAIV